MSKTYQECEKIFASRRRGLDHKYLTKHTSLLYDKARDCYVHHHYSTDTVRIYRDRYWVNTGGWDTYITWKNIYEFVPITVGRAPRPNIVGNKFVFWDGRAKYTEFYNGIEVDYSGKPLNPKPVEVRVMRKGATAEFSVIARKVRHAFALRMLVGEFDSVEHKALDDIDVLKLLTETAVRVDGLFAEFVPYDDVAPLFAQREVQSFGRPRGWGYMSTYEPVYSDVKQRLASNINAAKRAWLWHQRRMGVEFEERITKEFT